MRFKNLFLPLMAVMGISSATATAPARAPFIQPKKHVANTAPAKAVSEVPAKKAFAWVTRDRASLPLGISSFLLNNPAQLTSVFPMQNSAYSGCFANGKYFFDRYRNYTENGQSTWAHIAFSSVDLTTGAVSDLSDWSDEYFVMNDMAYDYTTGTLYAMCRNVYIDDFLTGFYFEYSALFSINTTTGVTTEVKQFIDWGTGTLTNPTYYTLACDLNGTLYSINQNGSLVYFDRDNDFAEVVVGDTGVNPAKTTQSMEFDHTTGTLYWAADYSDKVAELLTVDVATGRASLVGATGSDSHLVGLYIPFDLPSEAAPGAVTDYSVTPSTDGARKATVTFTTPTKSFGRANLASISSVKVLRNDQEIKSYSSPGIGATITFDDAVSQAGLYSYTVVAYNAAGAGLASGISRWVGKDVPNEVTNIGIGCTDEGYAYLQWDAPVMGAHGGIIDEASLGYKITRFPDGVIVAQDAKGTSYTDTTVPGIGRYYYSIESHTEDGVGNAARSMEIAIGKGIVSYPWNTLFADVSEFDLWTVVDANGGSTWQWKSRTAGGYNAMAMYEYDNKNTADDYLISPDLLLTKGARYVVDFMYSGSNANYKEKFEVTFGQGNTAAAQTQVLGTYTTNDGDFHSASVELPAVDATGAYNFAFHALSDPAQYNIYITDVTVRMTVAPPTSGDEYDFKAPAKVTVTPDTELATATVTWSMTDDAPEGSTSENIYEDFETMPKWAINHPGSYGWTYVDGDKGIPYRSDYDANPYPTDGQPLAAMVFAPYELSESYSDPNPPYSGDQYLLFKSNYAQADGSRPAPAPDDYFISPRLNFASDFIFRFYCKADPDADAWDESDKWNTEYFQVGYSTTDNAPESFKWLTDAPEKVTTSFNEWKKKEYSIPAEARYVCIHYCTPDCGFWFMVDDLFIGIENGGAHAPALRAAQPTFLHYDVYLDDAKVASTNLTEHVLTNIAKGEHVAKVVAVYAEGQSTPAVAGFSMGENSIIITEADALQSDAIYYNLQGMRVNAPSAGNIYIRRQGDATTKVLVK